MVKILVWVLVLHSWDGGMVVYDNLASYDSCDRLLRRSVASGNERRSQSNTINGSCTQVEKFVPAASAAPVVNVSPAEIKVPAPQVKVIVKEVKK